MVKEVGVKDFDDERLYNDVLNLAKQEGWM